LKVAFIGDIVGRPGRNIIKKELQNLKQIHNIDFVVANGENASHGFGITTKNADELIKSGIDCITGGNHSWDKRKDMYALLETDYVLRPHNYPNGVKGEGLKLFSVNGTTIAILNLMGIFAMPQVTNPFIVAQDVVKNLKEQGIHHIFIDFHAEASAEKRTLWAILKGEVSSIVGTHTHVGTDDLEITDGTSYVTDIGLTGCRDNVIGMDAKVPIEKALTGLGGHFEIPSSCKAIFQLIVVEVDEEGRATDTQKIKIYSDKETVISKGIIN
jgi:metallophosphoesterase (TIGR00282 family)